MRRIADAPYRLSTTSSMASCPRGIVKEIKDITDRVRAVAEEQACILRRGKPGIIAEIPRDELLRMIKELESPDEGGRPRSRVRKGGAAARSDHRAATHHECRSRSQLGCWGIHA